MILFVKQWCGTFWKCIRRRPITLGLNPVGKGVFSNKKDLINKHPEWKAILENPQDGLKTLIEKNEFGTIGAIIDVLVDVEFTQILCDTLGRAPTSRYIKDFVKVLIEKNDPTLLKALASDTFSHPSALKMKDLIHLLIEKGNPEVWKTLAWSAFTTERGLEMKELIRSLIEKGDPETWTGLAARAFQHTQAYKMKDMIELLVDTQYMGVKDTLLLTPLFKNQQAGEMKDILRILVEKANPRSDY